MSTRFRKFLRGTTVLSLSAIFASTPLSVQLSKDTVVVSQANAAIEDLDLTSTPLSVFQDEVFSSVDELADQGMSPEEIALELGRQIGRNFLQASTDGIPVDGVVSNLVTILSSRFGTSPEFRGQVADGFDSAVGGRVGDGIIDTVVVSNDEDDEDDGVY